MRVRMMIPEHSVEVINRETVPVRIDINDHGFPHGVPALRWHARSLANNPWIRRRFGHFALIDPWNQELLGITFGGNGAAELQRMVAEFHAQPLPDHLHRGPLSLHFMTAYELSFDTWVDVVDLLVDGESIAPGVRNASIHAFARFLLDEAAFDLDMTHALNMMVSKQAGHAPPRELKDPLGDDLYQRAAIALVRIVKLPFEESDRQLADKVRGWWKDHGNDEAFAIRWSDEPALRYAFLR